MVVVGVLVAWLLVGVVVALGIGRVVARADAERDEEIRTRRR